MATRITATITPTMNSSKVLEKMSPAITSDAMPMRMVTIQPIGSEPGWKSRPSAPTRAPTMISHIQCIGVSFFRCIEGETPGRPRWFRTSVRARLDRGQRKELAPQVLDLIAQLRGVLEPQLLRRREHLLLELHDELLEFLLRHPLHLGAAAPPFRGDVRLLEHQELRDIGDALDDRLRNDAVLLVVRELLHTAAVRLVERALDRLRQLVRVHDHLAVDVPCRPTDRLDERRLAAQETLLVGVEDRDERHLRQVEALTQQVHPDEHVVLPEAQLADDLDPLERVDLRVEVARLHARLEQIVGQVLGHLLRQRRDENALPGLLAPADLVEEVVDLVPRLAQLHFRPTFL